MTNEEFSNEFDVLIDNAASQEEFGKMSHITKFSEYEKSVFLTEAQEEIVKSLYNGKLLGASFEETEELRRYLSPLIKTYSTDKKVNGTSITENSFFFSIPEDAWFITYESVLSEDNKLECSKGSILEVVPVTQDDLHKTKNNPFRGPNKRRVLRLDVEGNTVELVSAFDISKYTIRYLSQPEPIILVDLPDELSINKISKETECKLNPAIHRFILTTAVNSALKSRLAGK